MARLSDLARLADSILASGSSWYAAHGVPEAFRGLDPLLLAWVSRACDGDWRRCAVDEDGSVTVYNYPVWERT